jgi:hypothetical protein
VRPGGKRAAGTHGGPPTDSLAWQRPAAAIAVALIASATLVGRAFTALEFGAFDSRIFLYIGQQWADGVIPYRDVWDNKPPGIFLLTLLAQAFPRPWLFLAVLEAVFVTATAALVWLLLGALGAARPARWFGAVAVALCMNLGVMHSGDLPTELYLALPATLSAWLLVRSIQADRRAAGFAALGGLAGGAATLFKTPGLATLLAFTAAIVGATILRRVSVREGLVRRLAPAWAGGALAFAPPVLYFATHGAALEMLDATFTYNLHYGYTSRPNPVKMGLSLFIAAQPIATVVGLAMAAVIVIAARALGRQARVAGTTAADVVLPPPIALFLTLWLLADLAGAMAGGRAYAHYLLAAVPSTAVLAGLSVQDLVRRAGGDAAAAAALAVCAFAPPLAGLLGDLRAVREHALEPAQRYWHAAYTVIRERSCPGDRLLTWEYVPGIGQSTNLRPATVVASAHYLYDSPYAVSKFFDRLRTDLERDPPEFLVVKAEPEPAQAGLLRAERAVVETLAARHYDVILPRQSGSDIVVYARRHRTCGNRSAAVGADTGQGHHP